eukprot:TRINITY_DN5656_c0_g1_i1.p1 TRINITY_DN5656_c0_g1~~TRINITY_DN5656_c0_g1_i1.p1  ORF type:complete len:128 (-),score=26.18 TRINITY_DN5656_c0_g1_i1:38-370(-)
MSGEHKEIHDEFSKLVNMSADELSDWLDTKESNSVGQDSGDGEAIGHKSGKRIVDILQKGKKDLTDEDYQHMKKVTGYIKRHRAQKPEGDPTETRWNYSLRNWGHDYSNE